MTRTVSMTSRQAQWGAFMPDAASAHGAKGPLCRFSRINEPADRYTLLLRATTAKHSGKADDLCDPIPFPSAAVSARVYIAVYGWLVYCAALCMKRQECAEVWRIGHLDVMCCVLRRRHWGGHTLSVQLQLLDAAYPGNKKKKINRIPE